MPKEPHGEVSSQGFNGKRKTELTPTDARSKGRSKVHFDYALQEGRKWNIKPSAEGKLVCTMPRCEGGKAHEVGLKRKTNWLFSEIREIREFSEMLFSLISSNSLCSLLPGIVFDTCELEGGRQRLIKIIASQSQFAEGVVYSFNTIF